MTFPELLDAALAGTLNQSPAMAEVDGAPGLSPERRLLWGASLESLRWLAGRPLEQPEPGAPPPLAAPETRTEVPPAAAARLGDILDRRPEALREWLQLVSERRLRVPPIQLPDLLEVGRFQDVPVRELILETGGARMVWLAKLNPAWTFAAYADAEDQFAWGSGDDRSLALRRIRRRDPARGRELLQATWRSERGDVRAGLLAALEPGLSVADEDVLVHALHDPRREIRDVAVRLLRRLPQSRWAARWSERAAHIVVRPPEEIDATWQADGLDPRPPKGMDATPWTLQQVMALTPPRRWPPEMLDAILRSNWRVPLLAGLAQAAAAYADVRWCTTLIGASLPEVDARPLYVALPDSSALDVLRHLVESNTQKHYATLAVVLRDAPWHVDPCAVTLAEAWLDRDALPLWLRPALVRLVDTLDDRLAMRREVDR